MKKKSDKLGRIIFENEKRDYCELVLHMYTVAVKLKFNEILVKIKI